MYGFMSFTHETDAPVVGTEKHKQQKIMKLFLIGMPGSGKSTLGKELAAHLMIDFVDLDAEIEKEVQLSIPEVFSRQGEIFFREVEARLLREWAASARSFVMATGGGAPCFHDGMGVINRYGISVFLDCPVPVLLDRVRKNHERPLLFAADEEQLSEKLERMLKQRTDCYRQAIIVLKDPSLEAVLKALHLRK